MFVLVLEGQAEWVTGWKCEARQEYVWVDEAATVLRGDKRVRAYFEFESDFRKCPGTVDTTFHHEYPPGEIHGTAPLVSQFHKNICFVPHALVGDGARP